MAIKRIGIFAIGLLLAMIATACSSGSDSTMGTSESASPSASLTATPSATASGESQTEEKSPGSKGFLWKIEGGKHTGYLAGTIHVARSSMYPLDEELEQAIEQSDHIALELDLTKVDQLEMLKLINDKALLTDGTALKDHVEEKDYEKFEKTMKKSLGAGAAVFDKYEPWYAAMTLESLPAIKYMGTDGIDEYIAKQAHEDDKTIIELESVESQIGMLAGFSDELEKVYFHQTVQNSGTAAIGTKQLLDMWTLGDRKILETMHAQYESEGKKSMGKLFDEYNRKFLVDRNVGMADKIDGMLAGDEEGTYLIAVGSFHMVGKTGLVSLLEGKGYRVEQVE